MGTGMWRRRPEKSATTARYACFAMKGFDVRMLTGDPTRFRWITLSLALICVAATSVLRAQQPAALPVPATPNTPTTILQPPPTQAAAGSPAVSPDYIIGPGDVLQVFVWRNPELTSTVPVRPDGKISTPLVEDMVAVGKTPAQLARDVETRLGEYVRSPQVSIIVSNAVGTYSQVTVVGQVKAPKSLPFREGMTLLDVVMQAGGLTDFAAGNRAKLIRKDAKGKDQQMKVHLDDLLKKGKLTENVLVKPGDVLLVPESRF